MKSEEHSKNTEQSSQKHPKKVLMVLSTIGIGGGVQNKVMDVYRNIDKSKLQFDFFVYSEVTNSFENEIKNLGGNIIYPGNFWEVGPYTFYKHFYNTVNNRDYYAVHDHTGYNSGPILLISRFAGIKERISHSRGANINNKIKRTFLPFWKLLIYSNATKLLANSKHAGDYLYGSRKFEIIPNALNINKFINIKDSEIETLKNDIRLTSNMLVLGHVGRFSYEKNQKYIINIAKELKRRQIDFKVILIGDGELKSEIIQKINDESLNEYFILLGNTTSVEKYYKLFDIFLFPSIHEGFGNVAVEAQVSGNKVIASKGVPKEVDIGLNLIKFIDLDNHEFWIEEIIKFDKTSINIDKYDIINSLKQKGLTMSSVIKQYYELYNVK